MMCAAFVVGNELCLSQLLVGMGVRRGRGDVKESAKHRKLWEH